MTAVNLESLPDLFFKDLKSYNSTNFRTLLKTDLQGNANTSTVHKAFSSVVTRYFIFRESTLRSLRIRSLTYCTFSLK